MDILSAAPWIAAHDLAQRALERNLQGITDAEALLVPFPETNSVNWLVGHILLYRNRTHGLLGLEAAWPEWLGASEPYRGGGPRPGTDLPVPLSRLRIELDRSHSVVRARLAELRPEDLVAAAGAGPGGVWDLADRHLSGGLQAVLMEARMADSLCTAAHTAN